MNQQLEEPDEICKTSHPPAQIRAAAVGRLTRTRDSAGLDEHLLSTLASGIQRFHSEIRTFGFGSGPRGRRFKSFRPDHFSSKNRTIQTSWSLGSYRVTSGSNPALRRSVPQKRSRLPDLAIPFRPIALTPCGKSLPLTLLEGSRGLGIRSRIGTAARR
jgi:hypothetical protein